MMDDSISLKNKSKSGRLLVLAGLLLVGEAVIYMTSRYEGKVLLMLLAGGAWVVVAGAVITIPPVVKLALSAARKAVGKWPEDEESAK